MSGEIWRTQGFGPVFASLQPRFVIYKSTRIESNLHGFKWHPKSLLDAAIISLKMFPVFLMIPRFFSQY